MARPLLDYILEALPRRGAFFVFPSAAPANFWLRKAALESGAPAAADRFMAWDEFKAETLAVTMPGRAAAGKAARIIFAARLLAENAAAAKTGAPLFREFINEKYAAAWQPFVSPLTRLLPGLDALLKKAAEKGAADPYFADMALIRHRYGVFMENYGLYEPAWSRAAFDAHGKEWFLFFPELAEDWEDYRQEVADAVHVVPAGEIAAPASDAEVENALPPGGCLKFADSGGEFAWLALTLRRLLDAGFQADDMAVSFPGVASGGERLLRELALRDVPAVERGGRPLSEHPGGRIFSSLSACGAGRWSYRSLKNLLLDRAYPWKDEALINGLMEFGLRYRCVAGFGTTDVWLESFRDGHEELRAFYTGLKRDIEAITGAKRFDELKKAWHVFEARYFDREKIGAAADKIIARAMTALDELAAAAERFTAEDGDAETAINVYGIFLLYLGETNYVFQPPQAAVAIYDYRVAAGLSPAFHFVINMNQDDASVISGVPIREDRKALLGIQDRDLSGAFADMYARSGGRVVFSFSEKTFDGPAVPLRALTGLGTSFEDVAIPWPAEPENASCREKTAAALKILRAGPKGPDMRAQALPAELRPAGKEKYWPTDLDEALLCPFKWFLERLLHISEKQTDIDTIDQRDVGTLYHRILERFFNRIRDSGKPFSISRFNDYAVWLNEETDAAIHEQRRHEGAFQAPVYDMLRNRAAAALTYFVEHMTGHFEGARVLGGEVPLRRDYGAAVLTGAADLILERDGEDGPEFIITDFKTNTMPDAGDLVIGDEQADGAYSIRNVQIASYVNMLEHERGGRAEDARFYSIDKREFQPVIGERGRAKLPVSRDEYQAEIDAVDTILAETAARVRDGLYTVPPEGRRRCGGCRVSAVCRLEYSGEAVE